MDTIAIVESIVGFFQIGGLTVMGFGYNQYQALKKENVELKQKLLKYEIHEEVMEKIKKEQNG